VRGAGGLVAGGRQAAMLGREGSDSIQYKEPSATTCSSETVVCVWGSPLEKPTTGLRCWTDPGRGEEKGEHSTQAAQRRFVATSGLTSGLGKNGGRAGARAGARNSGGSPKRVRPNTISLVRRSAIGHTRAGQGMPGWAAGRRPTKTSGEVLARNPSHLKLPRFQVGSRERASWSIPISVPSTRSRVPTWQRSRQGSRPFSRRAPAARCWKLEPQQNNSGLVVRKLWTPRDRTNPSLPQKSQGRMP
jgi:hypothetical protein